MSSTFPIHVLIRVLTAFWDPTRLTYCRRIAIRLLRNLVLTNFKHVYDKYQSEISRKHGNLEFRSSMPRLNFRKKMSEVALRCTFARFPWPRFFPAPRCRALGHQSFHACGDFYVRDISQSLSRLSNMSIYKSLIYVWQRPS